MTFSTEKSSNFIIFISFVNCNLVCVGCFCTQLGVVEMNRSQTSYRDAVRRNVEYVPESLTSQDGMDNVLLAFGPKDSPRPPLIDCFVAMKEACNCSSFFGAVELKEGWKLSFRNPDDVVALRGKRIGAFRFVDPNYKPPPRVFMRILEKVPMIYTRQDVINSVKDVEVVDVKFRGHLGLPNIRTGVVEVHFVAKGKEFPRFSIGKERPKCSTCKKFHFGKCRHAGSSADSEERETGNVLPSETPAKMDIQSESVVPAAPESLSIVAAPETTETEEETPLVKQTRRPRKSQPKQREGLAEGFQTPTGPSDQKKRLRSSPEEQSRKSSCPFGSDDSGSDEDHESMVLSGDSSPESIERTVEAVRQYRLEEGAPQNQDELSALATESAVTYVSN